MVLRVKHTTLILLSYLLITQAFNNETVSINIYDHYNLNFLETQLRPPNGISTDPKYDQKCLINPSNTLGKFQVIIHEKVTLGSSHASYGPMWVYNGITANSYTICSRRSRDCKSTSSQSSDAVGLASLNDTYGPSGVAVIGTTIVSTSVLGHIDSEDYFNVNTQCKLTGTNRLVQNSYYSEIRTLLFSQFSKAPNLLLNSDSYLQVISAKSSAYYLMKFHECSDTSCKVRNSSIDSVADSILFGNTKWAGPIDSHYPSDGIIVFAFFVTGDTLTITGGRPSSGLQPCRAIWYFAHVNTLGEQLTPDTPFIINRSTSDYLGGSFFAPDGKIVDSPIGAFAGQLFAYGYSWSDINHGVDIMDFESIGDTCDNKFSCFPPSNYTLAPYTSTTITTTSTKVSTFVYTTATVTSTIPVTRINAGVTTQITWTIDVPISYPTTTTTNTTLIETITITDFTTQTSIKTMTAPTITVSASTITKTSFTVTTFDQISSRTDVITKINTATSSLFQKETVTLAIQTDLKTTITSLRTSTVIGDKTIPMCNTRTCSATELSGDYTLAACGGVPCDSMNHYTIAMCGTSTCKSNQLGSSTYTMCGTAICESSKTVTSDSIISSSMKHQTMCGKTLCKSSDSTAHSSATSSSKQYLTVLVSSTTPCPTAKSSTVCGTATCTEPTSTPTCEGASCSNTVAPTLTLCNGTPCISSITKTTSMCGTVPCSGYSSTCMGRLCPTMIPMCGIRNCELGETSGDYTVAMCGILPCSTKDQLYTITLCGSTVCSSFGSKAFTMCGTNTCPELPAFTGPPTYWHHHDNRLLRHTHLHTHSMHYHRLHGSPRAWSGTNMDWVIWTAQTNGYGPIPHT